MSTVSGLNARAEKGKSKYVALDINSLYKGKSLENPKATVQPKHGLQSLGKVGAGRRMPPPANLPSLKSENSGNNPNISLVPSGGQGWGSATKEKGKPEENTGNQQQSSQSQPASSHSQTLPKTQPTTNTTVAPTTSKTWSSVTSNQEDGGQERTFLGQQSPFFPQEFPKLAGGDVPTEGTPKSSADTQYGPGPSLRPQTEGSWGRGTLQQHQQQQQPPGTAGVLQQNSGSGVNGPPTPTESQPLPSSQQHMREQRPYSTASRSAPVPPSSIGSGASISGSAPTTPPVLGSGPPGPNVGGQIGPGSALHPPPPQFRGMLPPYMYSRNTYPSGYPSNFSVPAGPPLQTRQPYPYPENRRSQPVRPLAEEEAYQRPAAIITEKDLKGFDEILQNDTQDTWATSPGEIDYNAKLVFSDDEESPATQKKDRREEEEKIPRVHDNNKREKERDRDNERNVGDRERDERTRDSDWNKESRLEKKPDRDVEWNNDRRDAFDRDRDERWKTWIPPPPPQGRPAPSLGMEMQRQWQPSQQPQRMPFDYRGPPPPQPHGTAYAPPHVRVGPGPVPPPPPQHPAYPPRSARSGQRPPSIADDDEVWRQRRKQQSDEMNVAVERARQRRAEDEKHYEQSKQTAQEKAKTFEKNDKGACHQFHPMDESGSSDAQCEKESKENLDDDNERSRHSSESRDDKPPSRDGRERERERDRAQANFQGFGFSRQFQKNVPPRFQKQVEFMRQQQTQQPPSVPTPPPAAGQSSQLYLRQPQQPPSPGQCPPPPPPPSSHQVPTSPSSHVASQAPLPMNMNYDHRWNTHPAPSYVNQMSGMPVSKNSTRPRSNSQGSGTDSYESDRCTPDQTVPYERETRERYWKDRRQVPQGPYGAWHSPVGDEGYYENNESNNRIYEQRSDFKRFPEKEEKAFNSHNREVERRDREFENEDYHYRNREGASFKERPEQKHIDPFRETKEKETKSNCWSNSREYDERVSDHFEELSETSNNKPLMKERHDRWEKERPQRPDSRDSRTSRESLKEERHSSEWHENQSSHNVQPEREHSFSSREEKKEKSVSINWGDTPYPMESKRREYHHHPAPITPKQFESIAPPRKNLTTLKRSTANSASQNASDSKSDLSKEDSNKQTEMEVNVKKEKEIKEEKNEKLRNESSTKESEKKTDEKIDLTNIEKLSVGREIHKEHDTEPVIDSFKKDSAVSSEEKDKFGRETRDIKDKHEHMRNEQGRDRRKEGRDRTGGNSRSRGGNAPVAGSGTSVGNGVSTRFDSVRGRGSRGSGGYGGQGSGFRGRSREYRRSSTKVERGPRFERQRERDKDKFDRKDKHTDDSSCSEVEDGKLGHLRQKDEDSEVSVDEASASTTESAQAEKYQGIDASHDEEKNLNAVLSNSLKEDVSRSEKFQKDKRDLPKRENKSYEFERSKEEKGGFAPRGEPSRRGRGSSTVFRNSRGGPRYGPSNYGPPPSKAAFGSGKPEKLEEQKNEELCKDISEECKTSAQQLQLSNTVMNRDSNKSHSLERHQQRRPTRFEHLPPRFQKRQARRYDNFDHSLRGKGRGRSSGYQGGGNLLANKLSQAKENLSDVANEEWETASESSDVAERRDRRDEQKDEHKRKESKEKGNSSSRKSFSSQRPMNESNQTRRTTTESRRGGHNSDRNRQRDAYGRDNRSRDSGRGRPTIGGNYNTGNGGPPGSDRRLMSNNGNSSRPSSTTGQPGSIGSRNTRGGHPSTKTSSFPPKNEGTAAVYRVDEIKLQDPNSVQAAINDLNNRKNLKSEAVAVNKTSKVEKEKSGGLEGYDLNNYASVVVIDDHPEVAGEDTDFLCDTEDGFQEVTSKKRHKAALDSEVKKLKKEPNARNKNGSRSRQNRLPPRFAKQRESNQTNFVKSSSIAVPATAAWDVPDIAAVSSKQTQFCVGDTSPAPPPSVNAWEKPITHSLQNHSQNVGQISSASSACSSNSATAVISTTSAAISTDMQILATASKSSSFDRSDQHDSGIDVSDQPASAASSQRSSPSNDCKIITPKSSASTGNIPTTETCSNIVTDIDSCRPMCTVVFENKNFKAENAALDKFGTQSKNQITKEVNGSDDCLTTVGNSLKSKDTSDVEESKVLELPVTFSSKEQFGKGEGADMKLDFTFDSELDQLTDEKSLNSSRTSTAVANKPTNIGRSMEVANGNTPVGVQSPISPSADELNLKIASVKKVWENVAPMPTVLEHPQSSSVQEDSSCPTSYSSYSGNSEPSPNSYSSSVDSSSQTRKDASVDPTDISYRENSQLQQTCSTASLITKPVDHSVCSVKPQAVHLPQHNPIPGPHCAGPVSPPLMSSLDTTITGIRTIPGLASSVQVAGIPAIPSPPTVLFNSSQQMAQTGLYQPLQMDSRQSQAAAVAAAMVQFSQSPHGYAPLGTYGLSHQPPPPSAQLSSAFGQQSLFVQPPSAHQGQDMYPTNQYRVQPPYPQSQHATSNQVLNAQQNMASSHLLGSQLVQTRPNAGHSATAPHLQGLHSLQPVQPGSQTSYFSSSAQAQTAANFYHQPPTTLGSPMQQQPHFTSHQSYGSQSTLSVLPQAAAVTQNFRNIGSHQFKAPGTVMNSMVPETSACLRSATRSPTVDASTNRNMFGVGNTTTTTINSGSVMAVPQISSPGVVGKMGQPQVNAPGTTRLAAAAAAANKASQYALPQSQQHYYPFGQQKFSHVQSGAVRPQVIFPGVVRNNPHPNQHATAAASMHYPAPIQRPGAHTSVTQPTVQPPPPQSKVGSRTQVGMVVTGGKLTSAQQAKLRAEAVQQTHMFFAQSKTGKHEDGVVSVLTQEKSGITNSASPKLTGSVSEENQDRNILSPANDTKTEETQEAKEGVEVATVEE